MPSLELTLSVFNTHAPLSGDELIVDDFFLKERSRVRKIRAVACCTDFSLTLDGTTEARDATLGIALLAESARVPEVSPRPHTMFSVLGLKHSALSARQAWIAYDTDGEVAPIEPTDSENLLFSLHAHYQKLERPRQTRIPTELLIEPSVATPLAIINAARLAVLGFVQRTSTLEPTWLEGVS